MGAKAAVQTAGFGVSWETGTDPFQPVTAFIEPEPISSIGANRVPESK